MKSNQTQEIIKTINREVHQQMINEEKNTYDPEIVMPLIKIEYIPLKKSYNIMSREDTKTNQKRRAKRPGELEEKIKEGKIAEAREIIKSQYYRSITATSQDERWLCNEKTARKILKSFFTMIGHHDIDKIHKSLANDVIKLGNRWLDHTKNLYICCQSLEKALDCMNAEEMILTYETYLLVKKMILIESDNEQAYHDKAATLLKEKTLNAVYAAGKIMKS
ncbi:MAG: hypothetical protein LUF89_03755 [Ruminococcus sp.]|nr:hypothetical protein [Ruminococcus sp.]